jgi:DNA modification methylase
MIDIGSDDIRLYHGDCLDVLPTLDSDPIACIITDPPFGVGLGVGKDMRAGLHGLGKGSYSEYEDTYEVFVADVVPRLNACLDLAPVAAVFTGPHIHEQRKPTAIGGIYCSAGAGRHAWGFKTFLPILFYGKDPTLNKGARPITLASNAAAPKNGHPCPKPLEWMLWLVQRVSQPGDVVLDPFGGSGTTAEACLKTGRRCIVIEKDERYIPIIERRVAAARTPLFDLCGSGAANPKVAENSSRYLF